MKRTIAIILALLLVLPALPAAAAWQDGFNPAQSEAPYWKIVWTASGWAVNYVRRADFAGIVPETMYEDWQGDTTRAEFCILALNYLTHATGKTAEQLLSDRGLEIDPGRFTDTDDPGILAAAALGITEGIGGGRFGPEFGFTREQAATMLRRMCLLLEGYDAGNIPAATFSDMDKASGYAEDAIAFVQYHGIMGGSGGRFMPDEPFTREQSVATVVRMMPKPGVFVRESDGVTFDPETDVEGFLGSASRVGIDSGLLVRSDVLTALMLPILDNIHIYYDDAGQLWLEIDFPELPPEWEWRYYIRFDLPDGKSMYGSRFESVIGWGTDSAGTPYGIETVRLPRADRIHIPVEPHTPEGLVFEDDKDVYFMLRLQSNNGFLADDVSIYIPSFTGRDYANIRLDETSIKMMERVGAPPNEFIPLTAEQKERIFRWME
jgi:hypothetical protein